MNDTQIKQLYAIAHDQTKRWGASKSYVSKWQDNVTVPLYELACDVAAVDSLRDDEILPAIFGPFDKGFESIDAQVLNEYWFWRVACNYVLGDFDIPPVERTRAAVKRTKLDCMNSCHFRLLALGEIHAAVDAVRLTVAGVILLDGNNGVLNPLFFREKELILHQFSLLSAEGAR
jgi:hypothetical protein